MTTWDKESGRFSNSVIGLTSDRQSVKRGNSPFVKVIAQFCESDSTVSLSNQCHLQ